MDQKKYCTYIKSKIKGNIYDKKKIMLAVAYMNNIKNTIIPKELLEIKDKQKRDVKIRELFENQLVDITSIKVNDNKPVEIT